MGFFQKNINLFLMILIIISVVAYVGSTVFYQGTFQNITSEANSINTKFKTCSINLATANGKLSKTQELLNATETDIKKYDSLYENKTSELSNTKSSLKSTSNSLTKYTNLYTQEKSKADKYGKEVTRLTGLKNKLSSENNALNLKVKNLDKKVSNLQADLKKGNCSS